MGLEAFIAVIPVCLQVAQAIGSCSITVMIKPVLKPGVHDGLVEYRMQPIQQLKAVEQHAFEQHYKVMN
jgi:hypothetical protein